MSRGARGLEILNTLAGIGPVNLLQCFSGGNQAEMTANHRRDEVGQVRREVFERRMDDAAEPTRGQTALASGFVYGYDAADFERSREFLFRGIRATVVGSFPDDLALGLGELKLAAAVILLDFAVQGDNLAGLEFVAKIGGVEPDTLQSRPALPGGHLKDGHAASTEETRGPNLSNHGGHFAGAQFGNAPGVQPVLVAKRQVVQQIVEGLNTFGRQQFGELWADSFNVLNGGTQL